MEIPPMKKIVIVGHPKTGFKYISDLFLYFDYDVKHMAMGIHGTANWMWTLTPQDSFYTEIKTNRPADPETLQIIHLVRNPFFAIPIIIKDDLATTNSKDKEDSSLDIRKKVIYHQFRVNLDEYTSLDRAVLSFLLWNKLIEEQSPVTAIQVENAAEQLSDYLSTNGFSIKQNGRIPSRQLAHVPPVDWSTLRPDLLKYLNEWCTEYEYPTISEQCAPPPVQAPQVQAPPVQAPVPAQLPPPVPPVGGLLINGPRRRDQHTPTQTFMGAPGVPPPPQQTTSGGENVVIRPRVTHPIFVPTGMPNTLSVHETTRRTGVSRGISVRSRK